MVKGLNSFGAVVMNRSKPCKYILNKESCPYGKRCRFLHQFRTDLKKPPHIHHDQLSVHVKAGQPLSAERGDVRVSLEGTLSDVQEKKLSDVNSEMQGLKLLEEKKVKKDNENEDSETVHDVKKATPLCHFYLMTSHCKYGDNCKYKHSEQPQEKEERSVKKPAPKQQTVPQDSAKHYQHSNPPPLTLGSFIGGRSHVQRPHKASQSKKVNNTSLREVRAQFISVVQFLYVKVSSSVLLLIL